MQLSLIHICDGAEYEQSFKRGKPDGDLKKIGAAASTGTTVTFKPDPEMFQETTLYRYETLLKRLREEAFLNAGVRITLTDAVSYTHLRKPNRTRKVSSMGRQPPMGL